MDKNYVVTKANALITASYDLSLQEQKIILILASMVQPTDEEFREYKFRVKDFIDTLEIKDQSKYTELPKVTKELMKKVFEIREGDDILQLAWLSSARYKTKEGTLTLKFSPDLKPYMLKLKELYTSYKISNILSLKSKYSLRLYELLKSNEFKGKWEVDLDVLKKLLGVTEKSYSVYQNVKNRIILHAQKELKGKTDIRFEFEEVKTGRKVTSIRFYIHKNTPKKPKPVKSLLDGSTKKPKLVEDEVAATLDDERNKDLDYIIALFESEGIEIKPIEALAIFKDSENNLDTIEQVFYAAREYEVRNIVGYMRSMVRPGVYQPIKRYSKKLKFDNFTPRKYNYDALEKKLLGWDK